MSGGPAAITLGNNIVFSRDWNIASTNVRFMALLAHELTHIVQIQQMGTFAFYAREILWEQTLGRLFGSLSWPARLDESIPFSQYGLERQARIVQGCYLSFSNYCNVSPYRP